MIRGLTLYPVAPDQVEDAIVVSLVILEKNADDAIAIAALDRNRNRIAGRYDDIGRVRRAGSGRVFPGTKLKEYGFLTGDNLNPQKARILLALALTVTQDPAEVARIFDTY